MTRCQNCGGHAAPGGCPHPVIPRRGWSGRQLLAIFLITCAVTWWLSPTRATAESTNGAPVSTVETAASTNGAWAQPYGGCKEAWQAPHSLGADECRDHGWTVRRHLVVNPHRWIRYTSMPHCPTEDSGVRCTWNIGATDANGQGRAFWVDGHGHVHYVRGLR